MDRRAEQLARFLARLQGRPEADWSAFLPAAAYLIVLLDKGVPR